MTSEAEGLISHLISPFSVIRTYHSESLNPVSLILFPLMSTLYYFPTGRWACPFGPNGHILLLPSRLTWPHKFFIVSGPCAFDSKIGNRGVLYLKSVGS